MSAIVATLNALVAEKKQQVDQANVQMAATMDQLETLRAQYRLAKSEYDKTKWYCYVSVWSAETIGRVLQEALETSIFILPLLKIVAEYAASPPVQTIRFDVPSDPYQADWKYVCEVMDFRCRFSLEERGSSLCASLSVERAHFSVADVTVEWECRYRSSRCAAQQPIDQVRFEWLDPVVQREDLVCDLDGAPADPVYLALRFSCK